MRHVAVIGGGISGLAAAYELARRDIPFVLFERASRLGGVVVTEKVDGYTIDAGPDALLTQKPAATALCAELGLGGQLRGQLTRKTFVLRRRRLRALPPASVFGIPSRWLPFVTTGALPWSAKLRMAAERFVPRRSSADDESIQSFMLRRFGQGAVDYLAEPLLAGIHGGDPARLSMTSAFPRLVGMEKRHGSVIAGLRGMPAGSEKSPFVALPDGMAGMTEALVRALPAGALRIGCSVDAIRPDRQEYVLDLSSGERFVAGAIVICTPPAITRQLTADLDDQLSGCCGLIGATSAVTVALGYPRAAVRHPLDGTGFVAPRREGLSVRAVSWVSSKWSGRAPEGHVLLRAYVGGAADPTAIDRADDAIVDDVIRDLTPVLKIARGPNLARVYRWRDATPQMEVGHATLIGRIEARLAALPGVFLSASGFRGSGIADCVADARVQASAAAALLRPPLTA